MLEMKCVGDGFGHFGPQHPLSFNISVEHRKLSPTLSHQHHRLSYNRLNKSW